MGEALLDREWRSRGRSSWCGCSNVAAKCEGRAGGQALVECVAFKKAGRTVATTNHKFRGCLICEADARHDLFVVGVVAGVGGTNDRTGDRSSRDAARILHSTIGENVGSAVMNFIPRLIEFVPQAEVEGEPGGSFEVVLNVSCNAPLAVAHDADCGPNLIVADTVQNKIRGTVSATTCGNIRVAGENAGVAECSQKSEVRSVEVILLVTGRLPADGEEVPSVLPG